MTPTKDIIGIARDLQAKCDGDGSFLSEEIGNARIDTKLLDAFLIAVESLGEFASEQHEEKIGHVIKILPTRTAIKAMKALSRIRALS